MLFGVAESGVSRFAANQGKGMLVGLGARDPEASASVAKLGVSHCAGGKA